MGSSRGFAFLEVVVVYVEVVADRNEKKLDADEIEASSSHSSAVVVLLHDPEGALRLDGQFFSQKSVMDAAQVLEYLLWSLGQINSPLLGRAQRHGADDHRIGFASGCFGRPHLLVHETAY